MNSEFRVFYVFFKNLAGGFLDVLINYFQLWIG